MRGLAIVLAAFVAGGVVAQERDAGFVERARKEGTVSLYTSMQLVDSRPLTEAFEKKYGINVNLWRAAGEKIVQRVVTESRGGRFDVDVLETDGAQMEILHRERQLAEPFTSPSTRDIPAAIIPAPRAYVPTRLTLYVLAFNTARIPEAQAPRTYQDLLDPKWAGRFAIESADVAWLAAVARSMGETEGIAYFRKLADKGAPIAWRPLQPAFGQPSSVGVAARAPHPNAALLFADFILSREGQEIIKSRNRVPSSTAVDSPLNKFEYRLIDPAIMLDEWERWSRLFSELFLGGKPVAKE
jgi:iron(III) transport system substrate-binding protein